VATAIREPVHGDVPTIGGAVIYTSPPRRASSAPAFLAALMVLVIGLGL